MLRYSVRLSRRDVTRPAIFGAPGSILLSACWTNLVRVSRSSWVGWGWKSSGGISFVSSLFSSSFQILRLPRIPASEVTVERLRSALGLAPEPWHLKQYLASRGWILVANASWAGGGVAWDWSAETPIAPDS